METFCCGEVKYGDKNTTKISSRVKQIESSTCVRLAEAQENQREQELAKHGIGQGGGS
jgi:hypothetical protein